MEGLSVDDFVSRLESAQNSDVSDTEHVNKDFIPLPSNSSVSSNASGKRRNPKRKRKPPEHYKEAMDDNDLKEMEEDFEKRMNFSSNKILKSLKYKALGNERSIDDFYDTSCDELEVDNSLLIKKKRKIDDFYDKDDISDSEREIEKTNKKVAAISRSKHHFSYNCFACGFGNARQSSINADHANTCDRIIKENYGKVSNFYLGKMVHEFYKKVVYEPNSKLGPYPMWRTRSIVEHIEKHTINPVIFIGESIRRLTSDIEVLKNMRRVTKQMADGTELETFDPKIQKSFLETHLTVLKFFSTPIERLNFFEKTSGIDPSYVGKMFTVTHRWDLTKQTK